MTESQLVGSPLTDQDYSVLERSFITREIAESAGLRRVSDAEARQLLGLDSRRGDFAGIAIPHFDPRNQTIRAYRLRRDHPDLEEREGRVVEKGKYLSEKNARNCLYFVPWIEPTWLTDQTLPIVFCEGAKKCLALWSVAWHGLGDAAERPHFLPIGLSGVWGWRGRVGKTTGPDGSRRDVRGVIPDFRMLQLLVRQVCILFDSNVQNNPDVQEARRQLASWMTGEGARVSLANLPLETGVNGPDDAAAKHGAGYILDVLARATAFDTDAVRRVLTPEEEEIVKQQPLTGWLRDYTNYARKCLPDVPVDYHILTGLILEAGVLGGKAKTDTGLQATLAGVIVAFQGSGKSLPAVIARQLIDPIEQEEERAFREKLSELKAELEKVSHELLRNADRDSQEELSARQRELEGEIEQMERAGRPAIIIATQASVEGLLEALSCCPCGIADFDEFGAFLKDCRRDHMRSARENLIKALDGRPIYYRRTRGQSVDVRNPALSLWGTINVDSLRVAATDEDMFGGLFSRILFAAPDYNFAIPFMQPGDLEAAEKLTSAIRTWRNVGHVPVEFEDSVRERAISYAYTVAPFTRGEHVDITKPEDQAAAVGYIRYGTHAQKVAILIAGGESSQPGMSNLKVTMRHMLLAIDLVERFRRQTVRLLRHLEKSDPLVIDGEKLLGRIRRRAGRDRGYYQRLMRWDAGHFTKVLAELEHREQVTWEEQPSTGGRKRRIYFPRN